MKCYICDSDMPIDSVVDDPMTGKVRHCSACETVIQELMDDYKRADRKKLGLEIDLALEDDDHEWDVLEALVEAGYDYTAEY